MKRFHSLLGPSAAFTLVVSAAAIVASCGGAKPEPPPATPATRAAISKNADVRPTTPDFRATAPAPGPAVKFTPPKVVESHLANGVRVLVAPLHDLPIISVGVVFPANATDAPAGVASFAQTMLLQGTRTKNALELSDDIQRLGGSIEASADFDASFVSGEFLANKLDAAITILGDVAAHPAFDPREVERLRSRRLTAIAQENDSPQAVLSKTVLATLYPAGHPYGAFLSGTEESVKKITPEALAKFHSALLKPAGLTVIFAGDITPEKATEEAQRLFGSLKAAPPSGSGAAATDIKSAPPKTQAAPEGAKVLLVDRPGSTQSFVAFALVGVTRANPDYDALVVMNTILGGQFTSRLNLNLREKHAYTYGARSSFDFRRGAGPFTAGGAIVRESTGPAVREVLAEVGRMRDETVSEEELANAKTRLLRALPARFESANEVVSALEELAVYDLPLNDFETRSARIAKVTREDIQRVAKLALTPETARIVVVGDAKSVRDQLGSLGLGEVQLRPAPGAIAPAAK